MTLPRQKLREIVFLLLYGHDLGDSEPGALIQMVSNELKVAKSHIKHAYQLTQPIRAVQDQIDALISKETQSYDFKRIYTVERNILRLGVYELLFDDQVPPKVAISESMRLGKKFGTPASVAFINAIMDHLYKLHQGAPTEPKQVAEALDHLIETDKKAESIELVDPEESSLKPDHDDESRGSC